MRIAMISEHASPLAAIAGVDAGGQNQHVAELAAALHRRGHSVTVYTRRDSPDQPEVVISPRGFDVVHVPAGPPVALAKDDLLQFMQPFGRWLASRWASTRSPDVVHAHFWMSGVAAAVASALVPVPLVQTYHALGAVKRRFQQAADTSPVVRVQIERQLGLTADRVIAQCSDEVDELTALGVPAESIAVVPSGVDSHRFTPVGPTQERRPGYARVITVGRLVERKGYDDLVWAIAKVPEAELIVVGGPNGELHEDPEAIRLRELADALGVGDRLRLIGSVRPGALPRWYRSADVLACAPWYEPFGLTPLEAMACAVPVVAYAVGGLRDSVVPGVTGVQVQPGDVDALADALGELLADEPRRRRMGIAGRQWATGRYDWARRAVEIERVYDAVRSGPRALATMAT